MAKTLEGNEKRKAAALLVFLDATGDGWNHGGYLRVSDVVFQLYVVQASDRRAYSLLYRRTRADVLAMAASGWVQGAAFRGYRITEAGRDVARLFEKRSGRIRKEVCNNGRQDAGLEPR